MAKNIIGDWTWIDRLIRKLSLVYGEDQVAHEESHLGNCSCERDDHRGGVVVTLKLIMSEDLFRDRKFAPKVYQAIKTEAKAARYHRLVHVMMDRTKAELYFEKKPKKEKGR